MIPQDLLNQKLLSEENHPWLSDFRKAHAGKTQTFKFSQQSR